MTNDLKDIKIRNFFSSETPMREKRQVTEWQKIFKLQMMNKGLISRMINNSHKPIYKRQKKSGKDLSQGLTRGYANRKLSYENDVHSY